MLRSLDLALLRLLRTYGHAPPVETAIARFSKLGEHGLLWLGLSALRRDRRAFEEAVRAVLGAYLAGQCVKFAVRRARPLLEDLPAVVPTLSTRSYPSCHAATAFAGARVLSGPLPAAPVYTAATVMALSRPYLGVHWPSDTVAGIALGDAVARIVMR